MSQTWCLDTRFGAKPVYILLISGLINYGLKDLFTQPRLLHPSKDSVTVSAMFWGFSHGLLFLSRFFSLSCSGTLGKRIVRYALLGRWIGLGAPLVVRLLRLVERTDFCV